MLKKWDGKAKLNSYGAGYGHVAGSCEQGNELSGSVVRGELLREVKN
jgi:hypothetical protein